MKKILVLILSLSMTLCFAACGGSKSDTASTEAASEDTAVAETTDTTEVAAEDPALAEADYNQLLTFVDGLSAHTAMVDQLKTYREQYDAGSLTIEDLAAAYQQLADDSQNLLGQLQGVTWSSTAYNDQITLLTETLEALAQAEALSMEAVTNNDESKLTESDTYMNTYNEKFDAFLTSMGV